MRAQTGTLLHGICVGDIVWDAHEHFADYDKAVGAMGIPFYQCLGNHDMDYDKGGDDASDDTFQSLYGPTRLMQNVPLTNTSTAAEIEGHVSLEE